MGMWELAAGKFHSQLKSEANFGTKVGSWLYQLLLPLLASQGHFLGLPLP